jgi:tRNA-2-methylthio-N6-dimethylallyladenosine synthase
MDEEVLRALAESPRICEHLHLPMQSGSDRILRAMRRGYTAADYRSLVERARELVTGLSITTDLIAGFPGESDEDFRQTMEMMRAIEFDDAFTFQYSPRPGTEAATMPQQVPPEVRHDRLRQLISLQREITHRVNQQLVGNVFEVLVEKRSKRSDRELLGRTNAHKAIIFPGGPDLVGQLVQVSIHNVRAGTARGKMLARPEERRASGEFADTSIRSS